jgi:hypothetical protein
MLNFAKTPPGRIAADGVLAENAKVRYLAYNRSRDQNGGPEIGAVSWSPDCQGSISANVTVQDLHKYLPTYVKGV